MAKGVLREGVTATATTTVGPADLASRLGIEQGDEFPPVYATSRMISLMELAAARVMRAVLEPGELSVGTGVEVVHTAPTPEGATVRATARFLRMDGKVHLFEVVAEDEAGEIGKGLHRRAVVAAERLLGRANRRGRRADPA
jgi:fluoroacetyl-CoA thioesterase